MGGASSSSTPPPECCPPENIPQRNAQEAGATTPPLGRNLTLVNSSSDKMCIYVGGPATTSGTPPRAAVVVAHDAFGMLSGRTLQYADEMQALLGGECVVVVPDFFGNVGAALGDNDRDALYRIFFKRLLSGAYERITLPWEKTEAKLNDVVAFLRRKETEGGLGLPADAPLACIGFCWGGWFCARAAKAPSPFVCATSAHPSVQLQHLQRSGPTLKQVIDDVSIPMLLCPSRSESSSLQPDGWISKALPAGSIVVPYPRETHGFANRGDVRVPAIGEDVLDVQKRMAEFIRANFDKAGVRLLG